MFPSAGKGLVITFLALFSVVILIFSPSFSDAESDGYISSTISKSRAIPNVVHYTQLKQYDNSTLHFNFESFLSLYAAVLLLSPKTIFIHTDYNSSTIADAAANGSKWTQKILNNFPSIVKINQVTAPTHINGKVVSNVEAKSDFVRWEALHKYGGLYIDWDILPLRDTKALRNSGFSTVVGRQVGGRINPGCIMTKPRSALARVMRRDGLMVFDGSWENHSVKLVTSVAERLAGATNEILILDQAAMAPTSWFDDSVDYLFATHNETPVSTTLQVNDGTTNPILRWENRLRSRDWEIDFGQTYLLHAFKARGHDIPGFHGVSVPYVLARDSNYALAAWPTVQHMLEHGFITEDDIEP